MSTIDRIKEKKKHPLSRVMYQIDVGKYKDIYARGSFSSVRNMIFDDIIDASYFILR